MGPERGYEPGHRRRHLLHRAGKMYRVRRLFRSGSLRRGVPGRLLHPQPRHRGDRGRPARPRQRIAPRTDLRRRFPVALQKPDRRNACNFRSRGERCGRAGSGRRADASRGRTARSGSRRACGRGTDAETCAAQESRRGKDIRGRARRNVCRGLGARAGPAEQDHRRHAAGLGPAAPRRAAVIDQTRPGTGGRRSALFQRRHRHQPQRPVQHVAVPHRVRSRVRHGLGRRDIQPERQLLHLSGDSPGLR